MFDYMAAKLDFDWIDFCIAENTRAAYPIEYIPNAKLPCVGPHPKNVILLACDAFGVLPPVSKLSLSQTMYHFISGYTALVMSNLLTCHSTIYYLENIYETPTQTLDTTPALTGRHFDYNLKKQMWLRIIICVSVVKCRSYIR